VGQAHASCN